MAIRTKLLDLDTMEEQHEKTFDAIRKDLNGGVQLESTFDPDNQAALYLQAMADGVVFDLKKDH